MQCNRLYQKVTLGWLRIALAMMVIDLHYHFFSHIFDTVYKRFDFTGKIVFASDGCLAVRGFFVISGFLVSHILEKRYPSNSVHDFVHFTISRYLRIYPLFLIMFLVFLITSVTLHNFQDFLRTLGVATLLPYGIYDFFSKLGRPIWATMHLSFWGAPWTLPLDFAFYPLGFFLHKNKKALYVAFFMLIVYFCIAWAVSSPPEKHLFFSDHTWWNGFFFSTAPPNLLAFISGMISYNYSSNKKSHTWLLILSSIVVFYISYTPFGLSVFAADMLAIISFSIIVSELAKNGQNRFESFMGNFTFSIYLTHQYVLYMLQRNLTLSNIKIIAFLIDIILGILIAIFIEERLIEKRRRSWISRIKKQGTILSGIEFKPAYANIALALIACSTIYYTASLLLTINLWK